MSPENILVIVAVVTLLIAAAGAIGGQYRISRNKAAIDVTKEIAEAWEARARQQETQITELEHGAIAKDAEIADLKARVGVLQDLVTGKNAIENLAKDHEKLTAKQDEILAQIGSVRSEVRKLAEVLKERHDRPA